MPAVNTLAGEFVGADYSAQLPGDSPSGSSSLASSSGGDGTERIAALFGIAALAILALMELGGFRAVVSVGALR